MDRPAAGPFVAVDERPHAAQEPAPDVSLAPVASFFALAFALSWAWWLVLLAGGDRVSRGEGWPTHIPGMIAWAISLIHREAAGRPALGGSPA
jgi:hypothetical protein